MIDWYSEKKNKNPSFSLRALAKKMGFNNHTLLSLILKGERRISPRHLESFKKGLGLSEKEREYFDTLVRYQNSETEDEKKIFRSHLMRISESPLVFELDHDRFKVIREWYHMAILEMTELKDFKSDAAWIVKRLGRNVSALEVKTAIERLIRLQLLKKENGKLVKSHGTLFVSSAPKSEAIREHHKQVIQLAMSSIDEQPTTERCVHSFVVTIDETKFSDIEKMIRKFRAKVESTLEKKGGDETYQCSVQFFKLTQGGKHENH